MIYIPVQTTLVWLPPPPPRRRGCSWVLAVGRTGPKAKRTSPGWSGEAGFESSRRVVTRSGKNGWGWGSSGQAPSPLMVHGGFPEFGLASKQRLTVLQSRSCWQPGFVMHLNHLQGHSSTKPAVNVRHCKSR